MSRIGGLGLTRPGPTGRGPTGRVRAGPGRARPAGSGLTRAWLAPARPVCVGRAEIRSAEPEDLLVEGVHTVLLPGVHLGPAEGSRLVLLLEPAAVPRLPEPEDRTSGVGGLREHAGAAHPDGLGDHLTARLPDPGDGRDDVVGGEVDAPRGRHPAVLLGGQCGDQLAAAERIGTGAAPCPPLHRPGRSIRRAHRRSACPLRGRGAAHPPSTARSARMRPWARILPQW